MQKLHKLLVGISSDTRWFTRYGGNNLYFVLRDKTLRAPNQSPAINLPKDHLPEYGGDADEELS